MTADRDAPRSSRLAAPYLALAGRPKLRTTLRLAVEALGFPAGQINIFDAARQHNISQYPGELAPDLPRSDSVCDSTLALGVLAVDDLHADPRFADIPGVRAGLAGSYLGVTLMSREATRIGTLCVFDPEPRHISDEQRTRIGEYALIVEDQLEVMRREAERASGTGVRATDLVASLANDEIVPWYQPIYDLHSQTIVGVEALARLELPSGDVFGPATFMPTAEDSDLVLDVDLAVMRQALTDLRRWRAHRTDMVLNVNLSTRHLEIADGVTTILGLVDGAGLPPDSIAIELTETRALADEDRAREAVVALRAHGLAVLLDDFGSGWSSLDWMLRLDVSGLKVDRAVTDSLGTPNGDAVTRAVIALSTDLDLDVIIEGIQTRRHADMARGLGYRRAQGYYLARPVPASAIDTWLAASGTGALVRRPAPRRPMPGRR